MSFPINKIVVVGKDADAWIAALMLKRAFSNFTSAIQIHLVELNSELIKHDFFSVLPGHQLLHKVLGANESGLLAAAKGLYSFGQRFSNWSGSASAFIHGYDKFGADLKGVDFLHYWLKASESGLNVPLEDFSLGVVAAKANRFVTASDISSNFSEASYGYNLSATPYVQTIAKVALKLGVIHHRGTIASVEVDEKKIKCIRLANDDVVDGDFFIDASGSDGILIKHLEEKNYDDWSNWFGCNHQLIGSAKPLSPRPAFSQISAFAPGWIGIFPLLDRTAVSISYNSSIANHEEVLDQATAISGLRLESPTLTEISYGARKQQWIGNCVAVGDAAARMDSIDAQHLHLLHVGLSLLRALFPNNNNYLVEAKIYNEKMNNYIIGMRDYQLAHYYLNRRFGDPFWDMCRKVNIPESLQRRLELFKKRGLVALTEEDVFQVADWQSLFIGHGLRPAHYSPLVNQIPDHELITRFQQILSYISKEVNCLPMFETQVEINLL
ncbi:MAG TPA: tryptophan 7-halogenase [Cellvibrio sp.]|nr:tryptophan 7-halogenase [Cellvibrio sp.]